MEGVRGYSSWRWIFILEGLASVVLGVACFFMLIDTPALSHRWLNEEEIRYLELSMFIKQGGTSSDESGGFKWRDLTMVLTNWRVYVQAYFLLCQSALSYGKQAWFWYCILTRANMCSIRYQIHPPHNHQIHGLQLHQRPTHLCSSLRRRRYLSHLLRPSVRPLLLENAIRGNSHAHCCDGLCHHLLPGWRT